MNTVAAFGASWQRETAFIRRSRWDFFLLVPLPLLVIVVLAATFHAGVFRHVPVAVVDAGHSATSRIIRRHLQASPMLDVDAVASDLEQARRLLRTGKVYAVIYLPRNLEQHAVRRTDARVVVYFNAAFQTVATQAADAATEAVNDAVSAALGPLGTGPAASPVRLHAPAVQVTVVGNPQANFELFLETLATPLVLNMLLACATVFAVGREIADHTLGDWLGGGHVLARLVGKLAPYTLVYWLWCVAWTAYLAGWRGWPIAGSVTLLLLAQCAFFCATAAVSACLVGVLRKLDLALSMSCLYTGSGLSFAGATLTINGSSWFTRAWSALLPSTSYVRIQSQQWVMDSPASAGGSAMLVLCLFVAIPLLVAAWRLRHMAGAGVPRETRHAPPTPRAFGPALGQTLRVVGMNPPILSMVVFAVILYGFYYPAAYKVQTVVKLPVAVVDLDHSPLSRRFVRHLGATREIDLVTQPASIDAALTQLRSDRVDAAIVISRDLEGSVLRGSPGGIAAWLKGAYLVRARYIGQALRTSMQGAIRDVLAPVAPLARRALPRVDVLQRPLYNTTNGYGDYVVPGVATIIVQATLLFGAAMFMGLKRGAGEMRFGTRGFLGIWAAFTILGTLTSGFFFGFVLWFQDYPRGGNLPGLLACMPVFSAATAALGLLAGSLFRRPERGVQILAGTSIPLFFLSGLSWPHFAMPPLLVALARLAPSTTAAPMFLQLNSMGASLGEVTPHLGVLALLAVGFGFTAWLRLTAAPPHPAPHLASPRRTQKRGGPA